MAPPITQNSSSALWRLARQQYGVVTRAQLLELGLTAGAIRHRVATARLHPLWRGVYAVGRSDVGMHGLWMAAVLTCGPRAVLSHRSAAELWQIQARSAGAVVEMSVPSPADPRRLGLRIHRRGSLSADDVTHCDGIPVTTPVCTLVDLATRASTAQLERAVGEADKRGLVDPETLRRVLSMIKDRRGAPRLRNTLDRHTFALTDSELERRFLPLARRAGLPPPQTRSRINGFRVDFFWPELGLVIETDGLRYHRTPAQQTRDRLRDQAHTAAGLTPLRFTHAQVAFEPDQVQSTLRTVARRLRTG
jgi:very-short-patch-repair endonuclease